MLLIPSPVVFPSDSFDGDDADDDGGDVDGGDGGDGDSSSSNVLNKGNICHHSYVSLDYQLLDY